MLCLIAILWWEDFIAPVLLYLFLCLPLHLYIILEVQDIALAWSLVQVPSSVHVSALSLLNFFCF